jgi:Ca2+-binding RTX toxin-like protein
VGDDSVVAQPTFNLPVHLAGDFERFIEGISDAGHEIARAVFDLVDLEYGLRDELGTQVINRKTYTTIRHHADLVLWGNDAIYGGDGADLAIGDALVVRTPVVNVTASGVPVSRYADNLWQNADWRDEGDHWYGDDAWRKQYHKHYDFQLASLAMGRDTIDGGAGDDIAYGDSLAVLDFAVNRGANIASSDWGYVADAVQDGTERIAVLTDSADYWGRLNGRGDAEYPDDWSHDWPYRAGTRFDHGDEIRGGEGDDILFGQAGDDKLYGDNGDDWLVGGDGNDTLATGNGRRNDYEGSNDSSMLRYLVGSRMVNWDGTYGQFGLAYVPFGQAGVMKKGVSSHLDDFSFLTPQ